MYSFPPQSLLSGDFFSYCLLALEISLLFWLVWRSFLAGSGRRKNQPWLWGVVFVALMILVPVALRAGWNCCGIALGAMLMSRSSMSMPSWMGA